MTNENWFCYTITSDSGQVYSGATNNVDKRLRQHNGKIANRGTFTRRFKSAKLAILMGPMTRPAALSTEHRMKRFIFRSGGLIGRMKALTKMLSLSEHKTLSVSLTQTDLRQLPVTLTMSRQEFQAITGISDEWIQQRRIKFAE